MGISNFINKFKLKKWIKDGLVVGDNFHMERGVSLDPSFPWLIIIGNNVTLAPEVIVLCHDGSTKKVTGYSKIGMVSIGNNVFVGTKSVILPGVHIGENVIVAAGSIVSSDIPPNSIIAGTPAKIIKTMDEFTERHKQNMKNSIIFDATYIKSGRVTEEKKRKMIELLKIENGYIV